METNSKLRFSGTAWANNQLNILIVGLGGTGHGIAQTLALYGHNITVADDDIVEEHNCIPQGYSQKEIGNHKVEAFRKMLTLKYPYEVLNIKLLTERLSNFHYPSMDMIISCVDNFQTRKRIVETIPDGVAYIDTRLLAEYLEIYYFKDKSQIDDAYMESISGEDGQYVACTNRQTLHFAQILHGLTVNTVNQHIMNLPTIPRLITFTGILNSLKCN